MSFQRVNHLLLSQKRQTLKKTLTQLLNVIVETIDRNHNTHVDRLELCVSTVFITELNQTQEYSTRTNYAQVSDEIITCVCLLHCRVAANFQADPLYNVHVYV